GRRDSLVFRGSPIAARLLAEEALDLRREFVSRWKVLEVLLVRLPLELAHRRGDVGIALDGLVDPLLVGARPALEVRQIHLEVEQGAEALHETERRLRRRAAL